MSIEHNDSEDFLSFEEMLDHYLPPSEGKKAKGRSRVNTHLEKTFKGQGFERHNGEKAQEIAGQIYKTDANDKALTGRTPADIEQETGIPAEDMFPVDSKILYVGDPWQKMGIELDESHGSNLTIIDYEYGEVASFVRDNKTFREFISENGVSLSSKLFSMTAPEALRSYTEENAQWLAEFYELVQKANQLSQIAKSDAEYATAARAWAAAKEHIENSNKKKKESDQQNNGDELSDFKKDAWYVCVKGERGFTDIPDWNNIIKPKVDALARKLAHLPKDQRKKTIANETRSWVESIRLQKHTEKSNVVEAVFPQLPFKSESFDRLVASWSISAHMFAQLDEEGFEVLWDEVHRVLKDNGTAYIFPLNYYYKVDETLIASLEYMKTKHPDMDYRIKDNDDGEEYTLVLYKSVSKM